MRRGITLAVFLGWGLPFALGAQSADKVISQYITAVGGEKAIKVLRATEWRGEARDADSGVAAAFTVEAAAPNRVYVEFAGVDHGWSEAYNGMSAWRRDAGQEPRTLTGLAAGQIKASAFFWNSHFVDYKKFKWAPVLVGRETVDGHDAEIVEVTNDAGDVSGAKRRFAFDATTHLLLRETQEGDGGADITYGEYAPVAGVLEPHHLVWRQGGHTLAITLDEIHLDAPPQAQLFDFPAPLLTAPPDASKLIASLVRRQNEVDRLRRQYSCTLDETEEEVDGKGKLKKATTDQYYVFYLGNHEFQKHVASNGQPLDERAQAKEDARIDKEQAEVAARQKKAAEERASRVQEAANGNPPPAAAPAASDGNQIHIRDFLAAMQFYNFRREPFRGQQVLVFDFAPKPGYKPHGLGETVASKLIGTIWIDEQDREVARLQARSAGAIKVGGGILASVDTGSSLVFEQEKVNDEVWLPVLAEVHLSAHVLLLKSEKANEIDRFSDYKKFTVGTKIIMPGDGGGRP